MRDKELTPPFFGMTHEEVDAEYEVKHAKYNAIYDQMCNLEKSTNDYKNARRRFRRVQKRINDILIPAGTRWRIWDKYGVVFGEKRILPDNVVEALRLHSSECKLSCMDVFNKPEICVEIIYERGRMSIPLDWYKSWMQVTI